MDTESSRIRLRPTSHCFMIGSILFGIWLAAINYENNLAYLLLFFLTGVLLLSIHHTLRNLREIQVVFMPSSPVFAGQHSALKFQLRNSHSHPHLAIRLALDSKVPVDEGFLDLLPTGESRTILLRVKTQARGIFEWEGVTLTSSHPFGMFQATLRLPVSGKLVIYPSPTGNRHLPHAQAVHSPISPFSPEPGEDFHGLRNYLPGESQRQIAWKVYARGRPLMSKDFRNDTPTRLMLDWSSTPSTDPEKKLSQLALWIIQAQRSHQTYGIALPENTIPLGTGKHHYHRCLHALAQFKNPS